MSRFFFADAKFFRGLVRAPILALGHLICFFRQQQLFGAVWCVRHRLRRSITTPCVGTVTEYSVPDHAAF